MPGHLARVATGRLVISLTSVPPRFAGLGPVLASLVAQGADAVELWLPEAYLRFPGWDGALPDVPKGVTLCRCPDDLGPATKFLPALDRLGPGDRLLICDDDALYAPGWAAGFAEAAAAHPGAAIAASAFPAARLGLGEAPDMALVVQGFAGVLLAPHMVAVRDIPRRDRMADDIWLSAQLAATGTPVVAAPGLRGLVAPRGAEVAALQDATFGGRSRADLYLRSATALRQELGIWR